MKNNQKGFGAIEIIIVIILIGLIGAVGWLVYDRQKNKTDNSEVTISSNNQAETPSQTKEEQKRSTEDIWKTGTFKLVGLTYKIPTSWQDISNQSIFSDTNDDKYEELKIRAQDGFIVSMMVHNHPRGYGGLAQEAVLDFKNINDNYQWVIPDEGAGKVRRIYVGGGVKNIGEMIYPIAGVGKDGLLIEIMGYDENDMVYDSLETFNNKKSAQEAKAIFESLKFE